MKTLTFCLALILMSCSLSFGQTYKVLYSFHGSASGDGERPESRLLKDSLGNLYGTTFGGGSPSGYWCSDYGCGTVFELSPNADGSWSESVLYAFCPPVTCGNDGVNPTSGLISDSAGNLYGTTAGGGREGLGTVFELSPPSIPGGEWSETILLSFGASEGPSSCLPSGDLTFDTFGNLYGTTTACGVGKDASGTVFKLAPSANGAWVESLLYTFNGTSQRGPNGIIPEGGVVLGNAGKLYGTTLAGGKQQGGVVFELSPGSDGTWTETVIHAFSQTTGLFGPMAGVISDSTGNLYGTANAGGSYNNGCNGCGGIFQVTNTASGWKTGSAYLDDRNGNRPVAGVVLDSTRQAVFGTSPSGGKYNFGTVFGVQASGVKLLHSFCPSLPSCADGQYPMGGLIVDQLGNLYGTTETGGAHDEGVVFELTP